VAAIVENLDKSLKQQVLQNYTGASRPCQLGGGTTQYIPSRRYIPYASQLPIATLEGRNNPMGSIASTLNSINDSLLNEISNPASSPSSTSTTAPASSSSSDSVNFSEFAQLFQQLSQLETSNPSEFAKVTADAATKLQAAAQQSTDPAQASFLSSLATQFQQASQAGNLSPFDAGAQAASGHHGGHHHHHSSDSSSDNSTQDSTSATDPLLALLSSTSSGSDSNAQNPSTGSSS
jgi:hypothetical protein